MDYHPSIDGMSVVNTLIKVCKPFPFMITTDHCSGGFVVGICGNYQYFEYLPYYQVLKMDLSGVSKKFLHYIFMSFNNSLL